MSAAAAHARVEGAFARLTPEERDVLRTTFARKSDTPEAIAAGLGMAYATFVAVLNAALVKVNAFYAEHDAAAARRAGRLQ